MQPHRGLGLELTLQPAIETEVMISVTDMWAASTPPLPPPSVGWGKPTAWWTPHESFPRVAAADAPRDRLAQVAERFSNMEELAGPVDRSKGHHLTGRFGVLGELR
jgi:hypothetical protein